MARSVAGLPAGTRITDYISLGVLTKACPLQTVQAVLAKTRTGSIRQRDLPAHVVVYYVIALALYLQSSYREVLRCLLEGVQWLVGPQVRLKVTGKSGISQARRRLGWQPLKQLHDEVVRPQATSQTQGAWYRSWRLVTLDGSTLEVADTRENAAAFGKPRGGRGEGAYPQLRFVSLVENGTHVLFGTQLSGYGTAETALAPQVIGSLQRGMLCLADRLFLSYSLWKQARSRGAALLWRVRKDFVLPVERRLPDGSYRSRLYASPQDRKHGRQPLVVRVIESKLEDVPDAEPGYRLVTSLLDCQRAPAQELAALYQQRWEIETALDELKTHLRGARIVLRSKTPDLVRQEFYGLLLAHFAIRGLMHEAALQAAEDPDRLSYLHAVRVVRRKLPLSHAIPPSGQI